MAEMAGFPAHLEFLFVSLVLVAVGAVDLLALDLVFLLQVRFVDERHLLGELDLLGLELVIRLAVAVGGHAAGVDDSRPGLDRVAADGDVGETLGGFCRDMFRLCFAASSWLWARSLGFRGRVVALDATDVFMFALFPEIVAFLHDARVGQNVAVAAEELWLRNIRLGKFGLELQFLLGP